MKCISLFLLCAAAVFAQPFSFATGQAARLVIGQTTFTSQDTNSSDTTIGSATGIAYAANTLFVSDANRVGASPSNNRVLLFSNLSSQLPAPTAELQYNSKCPVCVGQATTVLGQPDFVTTTQYDTPANNTLRTPTGIASDGVHLVVADTDANRVLIWNHIPSSNDQPADVVVGQTSFTTAALPGDTPSAKTLRGPEGVWIQNGQLFIADTQNNRVLIYNHIPTTNGVAADVVLGAPNFTTYVNPDISQQQTGATASTMLSPVSVTSDGVRLVVSDLGFNRVLIFNHIPTANGAPADIALGQPDLVSSISNNAYTGTAASSSTDTTDKEVPLLCTVSNGTDSYGNPTYPNGCNATLSFPRYGLIAGNRLVVADGGNDRVLVWEKIPTSNGINLADTIIGEIGGDVNQASDAADSMRTPTYLAWDGTNLYVSDTYNRRINVYTIGATTVPYQGVRNAASLDITAHGALTVNGTIQGGDLITITINTAYYYYTVLSTDTLETVTTGIVNAINAGAGDPNVSAVADVNTTTVLLNAKTPGDLGNSVTYSVTYAPASGVSVAEIVVSANNSSLTGGGDAANVAPGTIVNIQGTNLASGTYSADTTASHLPTNLGGTEVYLNGIQAPILYVSPTSINAQVPWELGDTTSLSSYVRSVMADGSIMVTSAVAVTVVPANPGLYFKPGTSDPTQAIVYHGSSNATAIVSIDGSVGPGATATIGVNGRNYSYTSTVLDTLDSVRDALVVQLNTDPQVSASVASLFDRIILKARVAGPEGEGIPITGTASGGSLVITTIDNVTCCGVVGGAPVTLTNPAVPGETLIFYATGLGVPTLTDSVQPLIQTGVPYPANGPLTVPQSANFVSASAGGATADVLQASLLPGSVGNFEVLLHLNPGLVSNQNTAVNIAQGSFVSNQPAFALVSPTGVSSLDPALLVVSSHTGNFDQGQAGASYTITVTNTGGGNPTNGLVTLTDKIPTGMTLVSMSGTGWTCTSNVCTRSDGLGAGGSWPVITVIVNVATNAGSSLTNIVTITGGSSASSTSDDVTTVLGSTGGSNNAPVLTMTKTHNGNFTQGQTGATYTLTVSNASGRDSTSGAVTVTESLPTGMTLVSLAGTGWTCTTYTCTRTDSLGGGKSWPAITVTVNVSANAAASLTNQAVVSGGNSGAYQVSDATTIGNK